MGDHLAQLLLNRVSSGEVWLAVTYLAAMFTVHAFRPQQIGSVALLRLSQVLFALYLAIPLLAETVLIMVTIDSANSVFRRNLGEGLNLIVLLSNVSGMLLYASSVLTGLLALRTRIGLISPRDLSDESHGPDWH